MAAAEQTVTQTPLYFGTFLVTPQVFYRTRFSFALVNLKPLLPGHVLVCSNRVVPRLHDLSSEEITDLFLAVQHVGKTIEREFKAESLNIAIQDGIAAGQSVSHVHTHIIPRRFHDLENTDEIYSLLESADGDLEKSHIQARTPTLNGSSVKAGTFERAKFPTVHPDETRSPRSAEEMKQEAEWLARCMGEEINPDVFFVPRGT